MLQSKKEIVYNMGVLHFEGINRKELHFRQQTQVGSKEKKFYSRTTGRSDRGSSHHH